MARKITTDVSESFWARKACKKSNTEVVVDGDTVTLLLHGNAIARLTDDVLEIRTAGWATVTTIDRLNGIFPIGRLHTSKLVLHLGDSPWENHENWTRVGGASVIKAAQDAVLKGGYDMPSPIETTKPRVLLVDDESIVRLALGRLLRADFEVVSASSGEEALVLLSEDTNFLAIVSDMSMGAGIDGNEFFRVVQENHPQLADRFLFFTGEPGRCQGGHVFTKGVSFESALELLRGFR